MRLIIVLMMLSMPLFGGDKVFAFSGSLREGSYNKSLAKESVKIANDLGATGTFIDLRDIPIPFFDEDIEQNEGTPENVTLLKQMIIESNVVIITSPNYNGSFSGVLKNALDWVSRGSDGRKLFQGKKVVIMCAATGKNPASGLNHLRDIVKKMGAEPVDFVIPSASSVFDQNGNIVDQTVRENLNILLSQFSLQ